MKEIDIKINSSSIQTTVNNLKRKSQAVRDEANNRMELLILRLFEEAQQKVPTVTGALAASGHITSSNNGDVLRRTIGYGTSLANSVTGIATSTYAVDRHEQYNAMKPESYKWLELTMLSNTDVILQELAESVNTGLTR